MYRTSISHIFKKPTFLFKRLNSTVPTATTNANKNSNIDLSSNIHIPGNNISDNNNNNNNSNTAASAAGAAGANATQSTTKNNVVKKYILTGNFTSNNTIFTYSAIMEDLNYMKTISMDSPSDLHKAMLYYLKLPNLVLFTLTTGQLGFKKKARGEYESGHQLSKKTMDKILGDKNYYNKEIPIEIIMKGFGKGRKAFLSCLTGKEGDFFKKFVTRISDDTNIKFGGTKSRKARRV